MKFRKSKLFDIISVFLFLCLIPGLFLYNQYTGMGIIPAFLPGGGARFLSIIFLPILLYIYFFQNAKGKILIEEYIFFLFLLWAGCVSVIYFILNIPSGSAIDLLDWTTQGILYLLVLYLFGRLLPLDYSFFKWSLFLSYFICVVSVLTNINMQYRLFMVSSAWVGGDNISDLIVSYQFYGRAMSILSILCIGFFTNKKTLFLLYILSSISLFFIGSRSDFLFFTLSVPIFEIFRSFYSNRNMINTIIVFFFLSIILIFSVDSIATFIRESGRFSSLVKGEVDNSINHRSEQIAFALNSIKENPVFGNYGGYVAWGSTGDYPHNILSVWMNLGIVGFFMYVMLIYRLIVSTIKYNRIRKKSLLQTQRLVSVLLIFVLMALLVSKDYSYMLLGFLIGLIGNAKKNSQI